MKKTLRVCMDKELEEIKEIFYKLSDGYSKVIHESGIEAPVPIILGSLVNCITSILASIDDVDERDALVEHFFCPEAIALLDKEIKEKRDMLEKDITDNVIDFPSGTLH